MPMRTAQAIWKGTLKDGKGTMSIGRDGKEFEYSYPSRFESGNGTNPEEMLGAAHAGCFSMALSLFVAEAGFTPGSIRTVARVHLDKSDEGFSITRIELDTTADVPGMDPKAFQTQADKAKANCPVSRALAGVEITLRAKLEKNA
ncbi:MAG TPA: OsmC family protein [Desulfosarcina sp.]|nr:OsmC family protein [Desulfosarcina sp.]